MSGTVDDTVHIGNEIDSLVSWWQLAGADLSVSDKPKSWLEAKKKVAANKAAKPAEKAANDPAEAPSFDPTGMPKDLAAFRSWMLEGETIPSPADNRVDATGDPASDLMILVDMPEMEDAETGQLLSAQTGKLFGRMLAAIDHNRTSTYVAAMSPSRPPDGILRGETLETLAIIARHHVSLACPKWLVTMGEAPSRAFCGASLAESRLCKHNINHDGGTVSVIATFHPRFLLQDPLFKKESWKDLQMLIEGMTA